MNRHHNTLNCMITTFHTPPYPFVVLHDAKCGEGPSTHRGQDLTVRKIDVLLNVSSIQIICSSQLTIGNWQVEADRLSNYTIQVTVSLETTHDKVIRSCVLYQLRSDYNIYSTRYGRHTRQWVLTSHYEQTPVRHSPSITVLSNGWHTSDYW